ncbi:DUF2839 family protein [Chroococcus sp. FPU101]|uniref:DUF2839 family protein n=1 Tax=Chroococcus sp. FPU101 TaxID=1974212 RepID=UPI001A90A6FE|nr:hypothetical protein [Chroococcus sp. FPU101]GFE71865.1 hypothetical protein CFPU101_44750 [Chroococcus sp. FPU101]
MGEAKRRKQILGESYGKIPDVLIEGTPQWKKHIEKFDQAWCSKWTELMQVVEHQELGDAESFDPADLIQIREELEKWLAEYLSVYRAKNQEQLVCIILDDHYDELSELLIEAEEANNSEKVQGYSKNALLWVMQALFYFSLLSPYLTPQRAREYTKALNSFYQMTIEEKRQDGIDAEELDAITILFSDALGSYFEEKPSQESVSDAPLELKYSVPKQEFFS